MAADPIEKRLERRGQQQDLIREQVEIEGLRDQSHLAAGDRKTAATRSQDAAKVRGDLTRVAKSIRPDAPKPDESKRPEKPVIEPNRFEITDGRDLQNLMAGRMKPITKPPEATLRRADAGTLQPPRQPRPATEISRPSGSTRLAEGRAIRGRREAAIAERPRGEAPREQAHLRAGTPKPLSFLQRLRIAVRIRAYVANLFKPKSPSSPEGAHARQLQASVSQKRLPSSDPKNQSAPKSAPGQPAGTTTTGTKGAAKEAGTPEMAGHLFAFDGTTGDAETQAGVADNRDAFYRLVEPNASPLSFNADAWNQVQKERSDPPHLRNTSTETTHDHRRVEARRGRGDRLTG